MGQAVCCRCNAGVRTPRVHVQTVKGSFFLVAEGELHTTRKRLFQALHRVRRVSFSMYPVISIVTLRYPAAGLLGVG